MNKIVSLLAVAALASADSFSSYNAPGGGGSIGGGSIGGGSIGGGSIGIGGGSGGGEPEITRNIYLYAAPAQAPAPVGPAPQLPARKVHYNFVFVRTSNLAGGAKPIVAPAPQQKTLVYLLSKRPGPGQQEVIEVPHTARGVLRELRRRRQHPAARRRVAAAGAVAERAAGTGHPGRFRRCWRR